MIIRTFSKPGEIILNLCSCVHKIMFHLLVGSTDFFTLSEFKSKLSVALSKGLDIPDTRCVLQSLVTFDPCKRQIICQSCDLNRWEAVSNSFHVYSN